MTSHIPGHEAFEQGADVLVMVHDRAMQWGVRIPLEESGACTVVVEHCTAESYAMRTMKDYIEKEFPGIPCFYCAKEPRYRVYT